MFGLNKKTGRAKSPIQSPIFRETGRWKKSEPRIFVSPKIFDRSNIVADTDDDDDDDDDRHDASLTRA